MTATDTAAIQRIAAAIRADAEFDAVKLILIFQNRADPATAHFQAWMLGPVNGQTLIADFIDTHGIDLEPSDTTPGPTARPSDKKARRIANGLYLYRLHQIRQMDGITGARGIWTITKDGETAPSDSASSLREAKAIIDNSKDESQ